jgi:hypothetical protein
MSFYPQPNSYQCGPFALKHALVMLGIFKHENDIGITAGSTWWAGTDEIGLSRAAKKYKCGMKYFQSSNPDDARRMLNKELKKGIPCILSVQNWEHWYTVVRYEKGKYVVIDSGLDKVITIKTSSQLLRDWRYKDKKQGIISYDGYAVIPKFKSHSKAKLDVKTAKEIMYHKYERLALKWDEYFNDLTNVCRPRTKLSVNFITFNEFLRRNETRLIHQIANWHGIPSYTELKNILDNMKILADVYDLIIPENEEKKCLIDLTAILMMYSCGKYGMDPMY